MKTLYIECAMGAAGDMLTAALLELHPDREDFLRRMNEALAGRAVISAERDEKCGIGGTHVHVIIDGEEEGEHTHGHDGAEHHHHHTGIGEIVEFIDSVPLPERVRSDAKAVFMLIAQAESRVHGREIENIHFHEVGSIDALADVLNVCQLIYELSPERIIASPVNTGSGTVKCAHGVLPVPAPATELILRGVPIYAGNVKAELCTPTGAALLKYFAEDFVPMPRMRIEAAGIGTGRKDFECANIVRVFLGETERAGTEVIELACNIDDMTGEDISFALERLMNAGALDAYYINIGMKKGRPAVMLRCMCRREQREEMLTCLFRYTTTLGVRETEFKRYELERAFRTAETPYGPVTVKTAEGYGVKKEKPEFEDIAKIAGEKGISPAEVKRYI